jgi:hypothetical protein
MRFHKDSVSGFVDSTGEFETIQLLLQQFLLSA